MFNYFRILGIFKSPFSCFVELTFSSCHSTMKTNEFNVKKRQTLQLGKMPLERNSERETRENLRGLTVELLLTIL